MFSSFINRIYFLSPSSEKLHKHFEFFSHLHFDVCFLFICIFNKRNSKQFSFKLLLLLTAWRLFHFSFFNFHLPHQSENSDLRKTSPTSALCPVVALTNRRPFSNTARGLWKFHQCYVKFSLEIALESEKCLSAHTHTLAHTHVYTFIANTLQHIDSLLRFQGSPSNASNAFLAVYTPHLPLSSLVASSRRVSHVTVPPLSQRTQLKYFSGI